MSIDPKIAPTKTSRSMARSTVLLVDDDADLRSVLEDVLVAHGFNVVTAEDGIEALELLREGLRPVAMLLDLRMPRMDGWMVRREQLRDPTLRSIPVAIVTAYDERGARSRFGEVEVIRKPVSADNLLQAVRRLCTPTAVPALHFDRE